MTRPRYLMSFLVFHEYAHLTNKQSNNFNFSQEDEFAADKYAISKLTEIEDEETALNTAFMFYLTALTFVSENSKEPPVAHRTVLNKERFMKNMKKLEDAMKENKDMNKELLNNMLKNRELLEESIK